MPDLCPGQIRKRPACQRQKGAQLGASPCRQFRFVLRCAARTDILVNQPDRRTLNTDSLQADLDSELGGAAVRQPAAAHASAGASLKTLDLGEDGAWGEEPAGGAVGGEPTPPVTAADGAREGADPFTWH